MNNSHTPESAVFSDAAQLGNMHKVEIPTGFLSSLDGRFLTLLYEHMIEKGLVYVVRDVLNTGAPIGFVSCVKSTKGFYLSFLIKKGIRAAPLILPHVLNVKFVYKVFESLKAPFKSKKSESGSAIVDCPELLSITILGNYKRQGIGLVLLLALENELYRQGVYIYKVVAGESLKSANAFYKKNGFILQASTVVHKGEVSNVYTKNL